MPSAVPFGETASATYFDRGRSFRWRILARGLEQRRSSISSLPRHAVAAEVNGTKEASCRNRSPTGKPLVRGLQ